MSVESGSTLCNSTEITGGFLHRSGTASRRESKFSVASPATQATPLCLVVLVLSCPCRVPSRYSLCSGIGCAACLSCAVLRYEGLGFLALLVDWQVANLDESTVNRRHLLVKRRLYCSAPFRFVDVAHSPTTVTLVHLCQPLHPLVSSRNGFTLSCAT